MSDYIFMLENHLSTEQSRIVEVVRTAAAQVNVNVFLTGGAMRDMLAGFRIRDLDFVVEGNTGKIAASVAETVGAQVVSEDPQRKSVELALVSGVTLQIAMSCQFKTGRPGSKPQILPATIQEDLRARDFTCNAIALSLSRASRGLLLDPMNGLADIERRELRLTNPYAFYDDPCRLLRLVRFRVRLGFAVEERTQMQLANAREAGVEKQIPQRALGEELRQIGLEDNPGEILKLLEEAGLLTLFSPSLAGPKLNWPGLAKLEKIVRIVPDETRFREARLGIFLHALTEKLSAKEKQAVVKLLELPKPELDRLNKLEAAARKVESALRSPRIRKPSQVYFILNKAEADEILFLLYHSGYKPVQERIRNYFQKYVPAVQEITPEEWAQAESKAPPRRSAAKFRDEFIANRLDRRPRKPVPPGPVEVPPAPVVEMAGARRLR
ncbi:MAG: CCA tRNA nucleotidyltransferase [Acidobacteriia bacterium]|nr:CCA tRNA nucleotidyltransferase [Terriglobia bacterium]